MLNNLFHLQVPQLAAVPQQEVLQVDTDLIRFTRTAIKTVYEWFSEITHLKMLQITSLMSMTFDNLYLIKGQRKEKGAKQMEERKKTRKTKLQRRYRA